MTPRAAAAYGAIPFDQFHAQVGDRLADWETLPSSVQAQQYDHMCIYLEANAPSVAAAEPELWDQLSQKVIRLITLRDGNNDAMARCVAYVKRVAGRALSLEGPPPYTPLYLLGSDGMRAVVAAHDFDALGGDAAQYRSGCMGLPGDESGIPLERFSPEGFQGLVAFIRGRGIQQTLSHKAIVDLFGFAHMLQSPELQGKIVDSIREKLQALSLGDFAEAKLFFSEAIQPIANLDTESHKLMLPCIASYYERALQGLGPENMVELLEGLLRYADFSADPDNGRLHLSIKTIEQRAVPFEVVACRDFCSLALGLFAFYKRRPPSASSLEVLAVPLLGHLLASHPGSLFGGKNATEIYTAIKAIGQYYRQELGQRLIERVLAEWSTFPPEEVEILYSLKGALLALVPLGDAHQPLVDAIMQLPGTTAVQRVGLQLIAFATTPQTVPAIAQYIREHPEYSRTPKALDRSLSASTYMFTDHRDPCRVVSLLVSIHDKSLFATALSWVPLEAISDQQRLSFFNELFVQGVDNYQKGIAETLLFFELSKQLSRPGPLVTPVFSSLAPKFQNVAKLVYCLHRWSPNFPQRTQAVEATLSDDSRAKLHNEWYPQVVQALQLPRDGLGVAHLKICAQAVRGWGGYAVYYAALGNDTNHLIGLHRLVPRVEPTVVLRYIHGSVRSEVRDMAFITCALTRAADNKDPQLFLEPLSSEEVRSATLAAIARLHAIEPVLYRERSVLNLMTKIRKFGCIAGLLP